jgi:hypothetical protein
MCRVRKRGQECECKLGLLGVEEELLPLRPPARRGPEAVERMVELTHTLAPGTRSTVCLAAASSALR